MSDEKLEELMKQPKVYEAMKNAIANAPEAQEIFTKLCKIITQPPETMTSEEFIASILITLTFWDSAKKKSAKRSFHE